MAKRPRPHAPDDPEEVHREMLRYLEEHPPQAGAPKATAPARPTPPARSARRPSQSHATPEVPHLPTIMLRRLTVAAALEALRRFVAAQRALGGGEVLVIVGKGRRSPGGEAVLRPQVDAWLRQHPESVLAVSPAPARLGGEGALLVRLRPLPGRGIAG